MPGVAVTSHPSVFGIIRIMGRRKIKKKGAVIPFRETVAYRFILSAGSLILFLVAGYFTITSFLSPDPMAFVVPAGVALGAVILAFYNLSQMKYAKAPRRTTEKIRLR